MARTSSRWISARAARLGFAALLGSAALLGGALVPAEAIAQDDDADAACRSMVGPAAVAECRLAVGAARVVQPRLGVAIFGGNPVPGTASTLGMRLGSFPRTSLAFRLNVAPSEIPPLVDRGAGEGEGALLLGAGADAAVGLLTGFSPVPTVGGVLSLDLLARVGYALLPGGPGFDDAGALGWALGARLGLLRESFTLPGVALTGTYGRITRTALGDPDGGSTDAFFEGAVTDLRAGLAATKRLGLIGLTGGVAWDRYSSEVTAGFREFPGGPQLQVTGDAVSGRWSAYANAAWTLLIFHASLELGWQESPVPDGIPSGVSLNPTGWFGGTAFRVAL